jgi:hypothetical protein
MRLTCKLREKKGSWKVESRLPIGLVEELGNNAIHRSASLGMKTSRSLLWPSLVHSVTGGAPCSAFHSI